MMMVVVILLFDDDDDDDEDDGDDDDNSNTLQTNWITMFPNYYIKFVKNTPEDIANKSNYSKYFVLIDNKIRIAPN